MTKIVDITDKLDFDSNPQLVVKGEKLTVNADATTVLKIMGVVCNDNVGAKEVLEMYELLFDRKDRKKIDGLKLQFKDFRTLVMMAVNLVTGEPDQGEQ